jgi:hypothetical protein
MEHYVAQYGKYAWWGHWFILKLHSWIYSEVVHGSDQGVATTVEHLTLIISSFA